MLQGGMFGLNVRAGHVDFGLRRPPLTLGYEGLGSIRSASQLETDGTVSHERQRGVEEPGVERVENPFTDVRTL
jgi:hypothetical protein